MIIWITGLPGSGKSALARMLTEEISCVVLDADEIRKGLNSNLGFSNEDRSENVRRIAEVTKLFYDNGQDVVVACISPFAEDRRKARALFPDGDFIEVYLKCSINVCKDRGKPLHYFDVAYEVPDKPDLILDTEKLGAKECAEKVMVIYDILPFHRALATSSSRPS
jgi:adenylylsulfate kinase